MVRYGCRRRVYRLLLATCYLVLPFAVSAQTDAELPWWDRAWRYRKLVGVPAKGSDWLYLSMLTGDRAQPDGRDVRVIGPEGKPVQFAIARSETGARHTVMFRRSPAGAKDEFTGVPYAVYFGNAKAPPAARPDRPAGLLLETRAVPEDADVSSWDEAQKTLRRAELVHGAGLRKRIFDAYNPYGPQQDYVAVYDGFIESKDGGEHYFATLSDDASFLLVNDKLAAEWAGRGHNIQAGRRGQFSDKVRLRPGRNPIRYVGFAFGGPKRMAVAWVTPQADKARFRRSGGKLDQLPWGIIHEGAFVHAQEVEAIACHGQGKRVCADFAAERVHYLEVGDAKIVAVRFTGLSAVARGTVQAQQWDFGDGQTSRGAGLMHVFLAPGVHEVTLTATGGGGRDVFTAQVDVRRSWDDLNFERWKKDKFLAWVEGYEVEKLPTSHVLGYRDLMRDSERRKESAAACKVLDKRRDELTEEQVYDIAVELGDYLLDPLGKPDEAEQYYRLALGKLPEKDVKRRFEVLFRMADLEFYYRADLATARRAYEALRRDYPYADPVKRRIALIRLGDIQRNQGKIATAAELYRQAEFDPAYAPSQPRSIVEGRYRQEAEAFLQEGEGKRALEAVERWLWIYPTQRLNGLPFLLRIRANLLTDDYKEVIKQTDTYTSFADEPDYLPRIHMLAGEARMELGDLEAAEKHWHAVIDKWPESPAVKDAAEALRTLEEKIGGE